MVSALELAKFLLYLNRQEAEFAGDEAESDMTPMKLQKLLYYCQGYSLALRDQPAFDEEILAWRYGPVVRSVYNEYKQYKGMCLPFSLAEDIPRMGDDVEAIARMVMRDKAKYSPSALVKMTHDEPAWQEAWNNSMPEYNPFPSEPLSLETMRIDFSKKMIEEMAPEEEEKLWSSAGREPTEEEWGRIALSL